MPVSRLKPAAHALPAADSTDYFAALWRVTSVVHSLEVLFYGWWIFVLDRSVPTDFAKINANHAKPLAIYGIVVFNALWFLRSWSTAGTKIKTN
jgi:hypothetical protein